MFPGIGPVRSVPPAGIEPARHTAIDFESIAATITPRGYVFVAPPRFERGIQVPKTWVLPLHHGAIPIYARAAIRRAIVCSAFHCSLKPL